MNRDAFSARLAAIRPADAAAMDAARRRQAQLAKPPGSLGKLEDISVQLAGITGHIDNEIEKTRIYVLAADNGVVAEGVSSAPQSVTRQQAVNLTRGVTGASTIAHHFGDELVVVDVGIAEDYTCPQIVNRRIARGTKNIAKEPAMTVQQALTALDTGDYGAILRAKGIVPTVDGRWLHFDYVPEEHEVRFGTADYTGRLCVIGSNLKEDGLKQLFGL